MNPTVKLILLILGIIAAVAAAIFGWSAFPDKAAWMFLLGWGAVALLGASRLP